MKRRDALWGYAFVSPQVLGFLVFVLGPLIAVVVFSLQDRNLLFGNSGFVGFENYRTMFTTDPLFKKVMVNSLVFTLLLTPLNVATSLALALLLSRGLRGQKIFRLLYFAPVVTSAAAWAIVWRFLLQGEQGAVNQMLALIGINGPNWLFEEHWAMVSVVVTRVIKNLGLNMVILLAAATNVPDEYEEAAVVDGANSWQILWHILLPQLIPSLLFVSIITVIGSLRVFDHILLLTGGGPGNSTMVLVYYVYYQAFQFFEIGYASALAVILFVVALILTVIQWALRSRLGTE
ncbi:MAG: carbohydrate ABC transporter permease [Candidatus Promineifilaceae bacterium]